MKEGTTSLELCPPVVPGSESTSVQVTPVAASLVPYTLSFCARVSSPRPVSKVESNCSLEPLQYLNTEQNQATVGRPLMCLLCVFVPHRQHETLLMFICVCCLNCR